MSQPGRFLLAVLLPVLAALASAVPVTAPDPADEDAWLADVARRAFDDPDAMLAELKQRWPAHAGPGQPREAAWLLARGRLLLAAGQADAADAVAMQLMGRADGADRSWLLRALTQERAGRSGSALAARALRGLNAHCPAGTSTSWNTSSPVCEPRMPSLSSFCAMEKPFMPFSIRKAVTPRAPSSGSVLA